MSRLFVALLAVFCSAYALRGDERPTHTGAGEFALAQQAAMRAPAQQRDGILAKVASQQSYAGEPVAAARTIRDIQSSGQRASAIHGAGGGGSFADFGSLMQLIETTVVPDTWEALGGPSTMAPYPQGVYVDPNGTVQSCETVASSDALQDLKALLRRDGDVEAREVGDGAWRRPSALRVVSLKRMKDEIGQLRVFGRGSSESITHMAGLSRIQYIMVHDDDILLAGPVGGIENVDGWYRDQRTGMNTLRSDFLFTCLASARANRPFGCTIDPTPQGLQQAALVAQGVQSDSIPVGKAAQEMREALGLQRVEVFGTAGDTPIGYVMVEADRHMKQLALGQQPMPDGVKNYLDVIDDQIAQGTPDQLLLRLWFTAEQQSVRADHDRRVFELGGNVIRLSGENQRALANGGRGQVTKDPRSEAFVKEFNEHWGAIRSEYPIYSALESVYRVASASTLMHRFATEESHVSLIGALAAEASNSTWTLPTPRNVDSIATHHSVRHGRKIHHVVLASGGVAVNTRQTVKANMVDYPSLRAYAKPFESQPAAVQRWWWDAK